MLYEKKAQTIQHYVSLQFSIIIPVNSHSRTVRNTDISKNFHIFITGLATLTRQATIFYNEVCHDSKIYSHQTKNNYISMANNNL